MEVTEEATDGGIVFGWFGCREGLRLSFKISWDEIVVVVVETCVAEMCDKLKTRFRGSWRAVLVYKYSQDLCCSAPSADLRSLDSISD